MTGSVALIALCELVEVESSVPVGEIRTVTTDHQTNHNDTYVNYFYTPLLNTITAISFSQLYHLDLTNGTLH